LNIGRRIAKIRKIKNIPQESICKGVVSRSHLSNLESGRHEPAEDILIILSERLGVPQDYLLKYDEVDEELESILANFKKYMDEDLEKASDLLQNIWDKYPFIHSVYQEAYFYLLESCYYIKKRDAEHSKQILRMEFLPLTSEKEIDTLPDQMRETYYYTKGVISYYQNNYLQCYQYYLQQLPLVNSNVQKAAIYFNIALALWKLYDINNAIAYAQKARSLYFEEHQWFKAADAYNSLGILYWENHELDQAEEQLLKALDMANQYHYDELRGRIYHNLGLVYKDKEQFTQCLDYFSQSLELKKKIKHPSTNMTYRSILNIYIEQGITDEARLILDDAQANCEDEVESHHLKVIEAELNLKLGKREVYESTMEKSIDFLKTNAYWKHITSLSEGLADHYQRSRKYKQASHYYKMSIEAYKKINGRV
jgi:transcriptional regulator with XRE-family HTH domain/Tfp pilus assembly protein PilF